MHGPLIPKRPREAARLRAQSDPGHIYLVSHEFGLPVPKQEPQSPPKRSPALQLLSPGWRPPTPELGVRIRGGRFIESGYVRHPTPHGEDAWHFWGAETPAFYPRLATAWFGAFNIRKKSIVIRVLRNSVDC